MRILSPNYLLWLYYAKLQSFIRGFQARSLSWFVSPISSSLFGLFHFLEVDWIWGSFPQMIEYDNLYIVCTCNPYQRVRGHLLWTICKGLLNLGMSSIWIIGSHLFWILCDLSSGWTCVLFVLRHPVIAMINLWVGSVPSGLISLKQRHLVVTWVRSSCLPSEFSLPGNEWLLHTCTCHAKMAVNTWCFDFDNRDEPIYSYRPVMTHAEMIAWSNNI